MPPDRYRTLQPEPVRTREPARKIKIWDVALTVVLLVLLAFFALGASYVGQVIGFVSDPCAGQACDFGLINLGVWVGVLSPWVLLLLAMALAVVQLVRHRVAFWVPLAAAALMVGMFFVGIAIAGAGVG
jgi:sterol desaturase/sphingolipid hydroxylase (fatty acid hydroxylase superfamily)